VASDLTGTEHADLVQPNVAPVERPTPPKPSPTRPHRLRFFTIYGILALALAAGVVGVVVYAGRAISPGPAWSSWKPSGGGLGAAKQIAEHVSPGYRLPDGNQLVDVIAKGPAVSSAGQSIPIPFIALRGPKGKVDQVMQVSPDNTFTFSLCGLGQSCAIATSHAATNASATAIVRVVMPPPNFA
jgi:hypothetical protein